MQHIHWLGSVKNTNFLSLQFSESNKTNYELSCVLTSKTPLRPIVILVPSKIFIVPLNLLIPRTL